MEDKILSRMGDSVTTNDKSPIGGDGVGRTNQIDGIQSIIEAYQQ